MGSLGKQCLLLCSAISGTSDLTHLHPRPLADEIPTDSGIFVVTVSEEKRESEIILLIIKLLLRYYRCHLAHISLAKQVLSSYLTSKGIYKCDPTTLGNGVREGTLVESLKE